MSIYSLLNYKTLDLNVQGRIELLNVCSGLSFIEIIECNKHLLITFDNNNNVNVIGSKDDSLSTFFSRKFDDTIVQIPNKTNTDSYLLILCENSLLFFTFNANFSISISHSIDLLDPPLNLSHGINSSGFFAIIQSLNCTFLGVDENNILFHVQIGVNILPCLFSILPRHDFLIIYHEFSMHSYSLDNILSEVTGYVPKFSKKTNVLSAKTPKFNHPKQLFLKPLWQTMYSVPSSHLETSESYELILTISRNTISALSILNGETLFSNTVDFKPLKTQILRCQDQTTIKPKDVKFLVLTKEDIILLFKGDTLIWAVKSESTIAHVLPPVKILSDGPDGLIPLFYKDGTIALAYFGTVPVSEKDLVNSLRSKLYSDISEEKMLEKIDSNTKEIESKFLSGPAAKSLISKPPQFEEIQFFSNFKKTTANVGKLVIKLNLSNILNPLLSPNYILMLDTSKYFEINPREFTFKCAKKVHSIETNVLIGSYSKLLPPIDDIININLFVTSKTEITDSFDTSTLVCSSDHRIPDDFYLKVEKIKKDDARLIHNKLRLTFSASNYFSLTDLFSLHKLDDSEAVIIKFEGIDSEFNVVLMVRTDLGLYRIQSNRSHGILSVLEKIHQRTGSRISLVNMKQQDIKTEENLEDLTQGLLAFFTFLCKGHLRVIEEIHKGSNKMNELSKALVEVQSKILKRLKEEVPNPIEAPGLKELERHLKELEDIAKHESDLKSSFLMNCEEICGIIQLFLEISFDWKPQSEQKSCLRSAAKTWLKEMHEESYNNLVFETISEQTGVTITSEFLRNIYIGLKSFNGETLNTLEFCNLDILISQILTSFRKVDKNLLT